MKIGFIGAGRAGCSLGKYLSDHGHLWENTVVTGFYSLQKQDAKWAADFTASSCFADLKSVVDASDTIVISTPDGAIKTVWDTLQQYELRGKIVCHLSGSLSSDVFSNSGNLGVYPISIHPLFAFSDRESTHQQLHEVSFTLEGHDYALLAWEQLFSALGNPTVRIQKEQKAKYHCAASLLSNNILAILQTGYDLLSECGFTEEEARLFSASLVRGNIEHAILDGCCAALTGPIERGDIGTVRSHLAILDQEKQALYKTCGRKLLQISAEKHPGQDTAKLQSILL